MNNTLFVKLDVTLDVEEWNLLISMITNTVGMNMNELNLVNKLQEGAAYDLAPEFEIDDEL